MEQTRLLSHTISPETLDRTVQKITARITEQGDKTYVTVTRQLELLKELCDFDLGRYLLQNQGINGYWTHYLLTYPWFGKKTGKNNAGHSFSELEYFLLNHAPTLLATQQRFEIFLKANQESVKDNATLACIPCGLMGELFYLDYSKAKTVTLIGIDYDKHALEGAEALIKAEKISADIKLIEKDAWKLDFNNEFDLISSNGLNIYEPEDAKVEELYRRFYEAIKHGGKLVTSFLTYPPMLTKECEWDFTQINQEDLLLQKIVLADIIDAKWQCFRSSEQTKTQLLSAGFNRVEFLYDKAKLFPTVIAYKK